MKLKIPGHEIEVDNGDKEFLSKIAGNDFFGFLGGDWIKYWRWSNLIKITKKVKKVCEENELDPQAVSPKFIQEFFEQASLEENEILQEMWASLLLEKSLGKDVNIFYINILKELESKEAQILDFLYANKPAGDELSFDGNKVLARMSGIDELYFDRAIEKFYSFNLLKPGKMRGISVGNDNPPLDTTRNFVFTLTGNDFCENVMRLKIEE